MLYKVTSVVFLCPGITSDNPIGTNWTSVGNPNHEKFTQIAAGPIYELWGITTDGYPYRRLGMCDGIPMGTAWELIPNLLLKSVSLGIYGPVAITKDTKFFVTLNGRLLCMLYLKTYPKLSIGK